MAGTTLSYAGVIPACALRLIARGYGAPPTPWVGRP
jgi:hypothetical protein